MFYRIIFLIFYLLLVVFCNFHRFAVCLQSFINIACRSTQRTARIGEGKRRNEFSEWHVAWLAEWHNYAECKIWKLAQINKLNWKAYARHSRAFFGANLSEQLLCWFTLISYPDLPLSTRLGSRISTFIYKNTPENWLGFLKAASKRKHWSRHQKCYSFDQELRCVTTLISWLSFWQLRLFKRTLCHVQSRNRLSRRVADR